MKAYTNHGKTSSAERNGGRKPKVSEKYHRILKRILFENQRTAAAKVTAELNIHLEHPVSTKTVRREFHVSNRHSTAATDEPLIRENNAKGEKDDVVIKPGILMIGNTSYGQMCRPSCSSQNQARFMFGEYQRKTIILQCLVPTMKHEDGSMMIWAAISWHPAGHIIDPNSRITARDYVGILGNQVHHKLQMLLPKNGANFQDDNSPIHTARNVQSWSEENDDTLQHIPRQHNR
jgi:hypothetical protein